MSTLIWCCLDPQFAQNVTTASHCQSKEDLLRLETDVACKCAQTQPTVVFLPAAEPFLLSNEVFRNLVLQGDASEFTNETACRYAQTQPMMDLLLAPEPFLLSERYASAVKTLGLGVFFMPVLPLSCVIALVGLFLPSQLQFVLVSIQ